MNTISKHTTNRSPRRYAARLMMTVTVVAATIFVSQKTAFADPDRCPLCDEGLKVEVTRLSASTLDSIARKHAAFNAKQLARIDSLFQAGCYGPPEDADARRTVHLLARISTSNAYRDLVHFACDPEHVYEIDAAALANLYSRYSDVNLFIGARLEHVRMGMGRVCVRYRLDEKTHGLARHGGKQLRWSVRDMKLSGRRRRVLDINFPTGSDDEVEIILARHHTFRVEYSRVEGPPAPYEWFLVYDITGAWLRKWGTHEPKAYMFWVSPPDFLQKAGYMVAAADAGNARGLTGTPLVGLRLYIPGLRLRMPILPDINVDDLRDIELPMPILDLDYLRSNKQPSWITVNDRLGFRDWEKHGPVPPEIRRRFPDR